MNKRWFILLAVVLTLGVVLVACQGQVQEAVQEVAPTVEAAVQEAAPTVEAAVEEAATAVAEAPAEEAAMGEGSIWVLLPDSASSARWETDDRRYFSEAFEAAGIDYEIVNAEGDARTQQTQFEQAITAGAKVILLVNLDSGSAAAMIASARDAGVQVIDYDRLTIEGPGADAYVSFDNVAVGAAMGQILEPLIDAQEGTPQVVLLDGAPTDNNATLFREGYASYAQPHFDDGSWDLVAEQAVPNWDNQEALVIFEQILTAAENNVTGVFAANDGLANSVISAFKNAGIDPGDAGIPISGQDATVGGIQHVLAGDQAMSTYKPIKAEAEAAAAAAIALFKGEDVAALANGVTINNGTNDIPFIALTPIPVTKENVADTVIADGFRTWDELCVGEFEQYCAEVQAGGAAEEPAEEAAMAEGEKIPLTLYYMPVTRFYYPSPKEIAEGMAADLANAGFDVQLELAGDWPTYLALRREGKLDGLYMLGWGGDNGDPDNFLNYFFGFGSADRVGDDPTQWVKSPDPREGWYANTEVAQMLQEAAVNPVQAERQAIYEEVEQLLHDDIARLWVAHNNTPLVFSSAVEGYVAQPVGADLFEGVTVAGTDTFIFGRGGDSVQLDPAIVTDGESFRVTGQILEPLYQYEPGSTTPIPALAEECVPNEAATEWTCTLRQGVKFHDGTDFNADAVVFNFDRWRFTDNPYHFESQVFEYYEYMWGGFDDAGVISSVEKVDDYTVKFVLTDSLAPFLANLAMDMFAISSPAAIEAAGEDYGLPGTGAVGTGPFKFVEWIEGDSITIEPNADYWGGAPAVNVIYRVIADDSARFLALQAGDIQGLEQAVVEDLAAAELSDSLYVITRPALNTGYLAFSYRIKEFQDPLVREAVAHAINRQGLVENFYGEYGEVATNFLPPLIWGHNDAIEDWTYDPELSRQLLAEAGFPDGLSEVTIDPTITPAE